MEIKKWFKWINREAMIESCAQAYVEWARTTIDEDDHFDFRMWFENNHCNYGTWYIGGGLKLTTDKTQLFRRFMRDIERYMADEYEVDVKFIA